MSILYESIVSYVLEHSNNNQLVFETFVLAVAANPDAKPLFHSDRGFQYTNKQIKTKLDKISAIQICLELAGVLITGLWKAFFIIISQFHTHFTHLFQSCLNFYLLISGNSFLISCISSVVNLLTTTVIKWLELIPCAYRACGF